MTDSFKVEELPMKKNIRRTAVISAIAVVAILLICWFFVYIFSHKTAPDPVKMTTTGSGKF